MGSLYRLKGRTIWMMKYSAHGRQVRESSGTAKWGEAQKVLRKKETAIDNGQPVVPKGDRLLFEDAVAAVKTDYVVNKKDSLPDVEGRITNHLTPYFTGRRMVSITALDVDAYIAHRMTQLIVIGKGDAQVEHPPKPSTINRELDILRRAFTLAVQGGQLLYRPYVRRLQEHNVRKGFFEPDQFESVASQLPPELAAVVRFGFITGWRISSEVLMLEWRQVNFTEKLTPAQKIPGTITLDVDTTKNDEGRVFPFTRELKALLEERRAARDAVQKTGHVVPWVFFRMIAKGRGGEKFPKRVKRFDKRWRAACIAAGCPGKLLHDFRRTAARNFVRSGIPERVSMRLTGHLTRSTFERYNIVSDSDLSTAALQMDRAAARATARATRAMRRASGAHSGAQEVRSGGSLRVVRRKNA